MDAERDPARLERAAQYRAYAVEAEQRVAWQTDEAVAQVSRSVVRAWNRLADELERVALPPFQADGYAFLPPAAIDDETELGRLKRRAQHARELAGQVPDALTASRLAQYALRLEMEVAEREGGGPQAT